MTSTVPFVDLRPGEDAAAVQEALTRVLASGWFVLGPEGDQFEEEFARASGVRHAVGVASGTDALALQLRALGIGPGDEVVVPALTAAFTALAVTSVGAQPVIADVEPDRLTLDPASCEAAVSARTRAIIAVHLYGQAADLDALLSVATTCGAALIEDCCQAHLGTYRGRPVGTYGVGGAFSFYPTKNLGGVGDGGAIVTNDATLAESVRRLRNGGQEAQNQHVEPGVNSRLDEVQAAVLRARLPYLPRWTERRRQLAAAYRRTLEGSSVSPLSESDVGHVYHLFVVRSPTRDRLRGHLRDRGIETLVHYPLSLPEQGAFAGAAECPIAARAASQVLSLPMRPTLSDASVDQITEAIRAFDTIASDA